MKAKTAIAVLSMSVLFLHRSVAQEKASPVSGSSAPGASANGTAALNEQEGRFKALLTDAFLSGRWAPLKDGQLGEEKTGDKYHIVSATKSNGDNWIVSTKLKYNDQEFVMPIPVQMKFAGDTAIMVVDKLAIPNGGTYSARLLFYEHTYSGTWSGPHGGGMLYGVITNGASKEDKGSTKDKQQ